MEILCALDELSVITALMIRVMLRLDSVAGSSICNVM